mmetsp:Transcript_566/g.1541  ORF Transcript_566/g.1541 Transcript_566/m.1541 type:complete len:480 (+) Transcript_566:58-1497(+)
MSIAGGMEFDHKRKIGDSKAVFPWLLGALVALLAGACAQHFGWSMPSRLWLVEAFSRAEAQWCIVIAGLGVNILGVVCLIAGQNNQNEDEIKPVRKVSLPVGRSNAERSFTAGSLAEEEASFCSFLDCCAAPRTRSASSGVVRHNSFAGGIDQPVWLQSDEHLHPKFCGHRLKEPGTMPCLDRFAAEELGNIPSHWEYLLPGCSDNERAKCRQLREQVRHVCGAKDAVTMLRFLRARQGRIDAAAQMYEDAMRWRRQTGYELGFRMNTKDDWLHRKVDSCWPPTALLGQDLDGDPIYWNRMGLGSLDFLEKAPAEFLIQHEVYTITRIMQALEESSRLQNRPVMYFTVVSDLGELSIRQFNLRGIMKYKLCVRTLEDNYPELIKRIIAIRVPRIAYTMWNVASHFFDEGTRDKIQIADPQHTMSVLSEFMDPKWIPEELGGTHRIGSSGWCEPCIPSPSGPPSAETMRSLQSKYTDEVA